MKIGLIADIHGDEAGLRRALDLLDGLGAERILCAGDLVERGSRGDAVIDLIRQRGIPCVKGNHEYIMLSKQESLEETGSPGGLGFRPLSDSSLAFIEALPDTQSFELGGKSILLAHATPWDDFTFVYPSSRPDLFRRIEWRAQCDVVILGHTHLPMKVKVRRTWIFNPGSIYVAGSQTAATLDLPEVSFTVYRLATGEPLAEVPSLEIDADGA